MKNLKGINALITGGNSGIGLEAARVLTKQNANVIIACRNQGKGDQAKKSILDKQTDAKIEVMLLDLSNLSSVRDFSKRFCKKFKKLDILINNAGVMIPPYSKTIDGFELQFGTNHLGHFVLTSGLMKPLLKSGSSRIVNISSMAHKTGNLDFEDLNWEKRKYSAWSAYADSKIANLYFTYELQRRLKKSNVISVAAHPGYTATNLQKNLGFGGLWNAVFAQSIKMGALPGLHASLDEKIVGADYIGPSGFMEMRGSPKKVESNLLSQDKTIANRLWEVSEELTNTKFKF